MNDPCVVCEGCALYEEMGNSLGDLCLALTYFRTNRLENTCPCRNCIVKPTCNDVCDERVDFGEKKEGYFDKR